MTDSDILCTARRVRRRYRTRDPFALAEACGVFVRYADFTKLKGMYQCVLGNPFIILKQDLRPETARLVCMHELGHFFLHRELARSQAFRALSDLPMDGRPEREANLFAADMLLSDRAVLTLLHWQPDVQKAAAELGVCPELLELKLSLLNRRVHTLHAGLPDRRFLCRPEMPDDLS